MDISDIPKKPKPIEITPETQNRSEYIKGYIYGENDIHENWQLYQDYVLEKVVEIFDRGIRIEEINKHHIYQVCEELLSAIETTIKRARGEDSHDAT